MSSWHLKEARQKNQLSATLSFATRVVVTLTLSLLSINSSQPLLRSYKTRLLSWELFNWIHVFHLQNTTSFGTSVLQLNQSEPITYVHSSIENNGKALNQKTGVVHTKDRNKLMPSKAMHIQKRTRGSSKCIHICIICGYLSKSPSRLLKVLQTSQ